jgi:hypothetical protein
MLGNSCAFTTQRAQRHKFSVWAVPPDGGEDFVKGIGFGNDAASYNNH